RAGDLDAAESHLLRGRALLRAGGKDSARAKDELRRAVELNADSAEAHLELGEVLARARDPKAATELAAAASRLLAYRDPRGFAALVRVLELDPRAAVWEDLSPAELTPEDGVLLARVAAEAAKRVTDDPHVLLGRGIAAATNGDLGAAVGFLDEAR